MDPDGTGWTQMDPDGPRWTQMDPDGPRWTQMDPDGPGGSAHKLRDYVSVLISIENQPIFGLLFFFQTG